MKIYKPDQMTPHTVLVTPGLFCADWATEEGKAKTFSVEFKNGQADLADNLGLYMIDNGMARSSPILTMNDIFSEVRHDADESR